MLRLAAAVSTLAIAIATLSLMQTSTPAYAQVAPTSAACESQAPQDAGDLQARPKTQRMFNAFANFGDIKGEATSTDRNGPRLRAPARRPQADSKHNNTIHIESYSWGMNQSATNTGSLSQPSQAPSASSWRPSPRLMQACAAGRH